MALALKDRECHNYGDYLSWPGDVRYELKDGDSSSLRVKYSMNSRSS